MMASEKQILVLNAGSSSLKLGVFDWQTETNLLEKNIAWDADSAAVRGQATALHTLLEGVAVDKIVAVGHRVVHGGTTYHDAVRVDATVIQTIQGLADLAPLHNPAALDGIAAVTEILPDVPQVVAFDTAFHATLEPRAYMYGVPYAWYETWGVRRFGFHGLSHAYCAGRAAQMLGSPRENLKLVTCHLGNGCSLAAIAGGRSVATTMGFTPLDGLMMGSRAGAVDPGVLLYLLEHNVMTAKEMARALSHDSGLKGISGISGDMRDILMARATGNTRAELAFQMYTARIRENIAAMVAAMDGVDALVFAGGVGEHAAEVRAAVARHLGWLGVALDEERNAHATPDTSIAAGESRVGILVIHTREELMVARETRHVLSTS